MPAFFLIMDDLSRLISRLFSKIIGPKEDEPEEPPAHILAERIAALEAAQAERAPMGLAKTVPLQAAE